MRAVSESRLLGMVGSKLWGNETVSYSHDD